MLQRLGAILAWGVLTACAAQAAQPVVNVQLINVCDDSGANCALSSPYASTGLNPTALQRIFDQAGVTVNLLAPVTYNSTAYLNPAIVDAPDQGYLFGSPTDPSHLLMNLPGHGQNLNRNVLDLWLVNTLPHNPDANGTSTAPQPFGVGLTNANGAIVTTGNNGSGYISGIDNVAHELAHNLGLTHTESAPLVGTTVAAGTAVTPPAPPGTYTNEVPVDSSANLLRGTGRLVPTNPCAIATPTCANVTPPAGKDQLLPFQADAIRTKAQNLFSVGGLTATATLSQDPSAACTTVSLECGFYLGLGSASGSGEAINGFKVRFLTDVAPFRGYSFNNPFIDCSLLPGPVTHLPAGGSEIAFSLADGCVTSVGNGFGYLALSAYNPGAYIPFSFEFDFSSGLTSRAAFNSDGVADSTMPFFLSRSDVPPDSVGLDVSTDSVLFNAASGFEMSGGVAMDVPEPPAVALLAAALVLAIPLARRGRFG